MSKKNYMKSNQGDNRKKQTSAMDKDPFSPEYNPSINQKQK